MLIRHAQPQDIDAIKAIADTNKHTLGFVLRPALLENIAKQWVLVAEIDTAIVGFLNYRHRKDRQTTIYEICVAEGHRGYGIGRLLINALKAESHVIILKCPSDIKANGFYAHLGFHLDRMEPGKRRTLNVWRLVWT